MSETKKDKTERLKKVDAACDRWLASEDGELALTPPAYGELRKSMGKRLRLAFRAGAATKLACLLLALLSLTAPWGCERFDKSLWLGAPVDTIVYCHNERCGKPTLWKDWRDSATCPKCGTMCSHPPSITHDGGKHAGDHKNYVVPFDVWQQVAPVRVAVEVVD